MCLEEGKHQRVPLEAKLTMSGPLSRQTLVRQYRVNKALKVFLTVGAPWACSRQYLYPLAIPMETVTLAVLDFGGGGSGR